MGSGKRRALPVVAAPSAWQVKAPPALRDSISHWERMRDNIDCGESPYTGGCACCKHWYQTNCHRCPVRLRTGVPGCGGVSNPYAEAQRAWENASYHDRPVSAWKAASQAEIDFLRETLRMVEAGEVKP